MAKSSGKNGEDAIMIVDDEMIVLENANSPGVKGPLLICGKRKHDAKALYPCDYNPFCLASVGGIVDQYRHCAARIRNSTTDKVKSLDISQKLHNDLMATLDSSSQVDTRRDGKKDKDGYLRRSIIVDRDAIQAHVSRYICNEGDAAIATCMQQIQSCHQPLVFRPHHAAASTSTSENQRTELSMPSGLRNLGATCYLNSQLQCLAQNLGFIHGLFSWRRPSLDSGSDADRRMATVLSNMQSILAHMRYGPDRVICTNEFASALNLENNEMQDPNEFARLLFDRMSDSFRRSTEISFGSDQNGLGELLPSVFGGTSMYRTKCDECGLSSERREDFMEISIPIVDCKEESSEKQLGRTNRGNKTTTADADVQQCLNSYLHPESLDGDNQYECSRCNKKCDATRTINFAKLPPVLNIQLARYVFDRETLSKRKLTTKVLLPKYLEIPSNATAEQSKQGRYILCAVQNHLGTSAHGGHYVAEVMDWTTGVWYEFNDEDVTILEGGPTSSFEPSETDDVEEKKQPDKQLKVKGSQDAYNLFYVEQSYLSKQCESEFQHFMESEEKTESINASEDRSDVLTSVKVQRTATYNLELENQTKIMLKNRRIRARQDQIVKKLLFPTSQLAMTTHSESNKIWIDSSFLRRFFSCQDDMGDLFQRASQSLPILSSQSFLCEHSKGLHPRVARQGKFIPPHAYNALEAIVQEEYSMFLHDQDSDLASIPELTLTDCKFVEDINLTCQDCGVTYQQETRRKLDLFTTLVSIYDDLIPGKNDLDPSTVLDPSKIYAISRTWITSFRKYLEKKVNELKNTAPKKASDEAKTTQCGGIDILDLSEVMENEDIEEPTEKTDPFKGEDPTSKITCEHRHCHLMRSLKSVRFIPDNVWQKITHVFPKVLSHRYEHPGDAVAIGNCVQCHLYKEEERLFPQKLNEWKSKTTQPGASLHDLLKRGKQANEMYPSQVEIVLEHNPEQPLTLHVLHHIDVQRWRDSTGVVEKSAKRKNDTIRKQLNDLLFISSESSPLCREWRFRPLTCTEHHMAVGIPSMSDQEDVKGWLEKLNESNLELLLGLEYAELIRSLSTLKSILHRDGSVPLLNKNWPTVTISLQKGTSKIDISPQACTSGCGVTSFSDECIENGKVFIKPKEPHRSKPSNKIVPIDESPKGPLLRALVHEVESGTDIDVAASQIMLDVSNENVQLSANGRPRRSRKARGGEGGGFPVYEVEMALDGNLAHFRLLLHQSKSKKLCGQRLFLVHTSSSESEHTAEELTPGRDNLRTIHDIISGVSYNNEVSNAELQKDCTVHVVLSYDSAASSTSDKMKPNTRKRMTQEEKEEEEHLLLSLTEIACGGWKTADASDLVIGGKKSKRRRQERGFQGTFLQSTEFNVQDNSSTLQNADVLETLQHDVQHNDPEDVVIVDSTKDDKDVAPTKNGIDCKGLQRGVDKELPNPSQEISDDCSRFSRTASEGEDDNATKLRPAMRMTLSDLTCHGCGGKLDDRLSICSMCKAVYYCSECVQEMLPVHYRICPKC
mmetsp:Transcript_21335/g.46317  ORF Transcript_21335/g.46317 Transcript_21335/m.46317 type:complete len:1522 (+) Transcript_21335:285-4850(+)